MKTLIVLITLLALFIVSGFVYCINRDNGSKKQKGDETDLQGAADYKIVLHMDTTWLYTEDNKLVGRIITKWDSPLDSLLLADNQ